MVELNTQSPKLTVVATVAQEVVAAHYALINKLFARQTIRDNIVHTFRQSLQPPVDIHSIDNMHAITCNLHLDYI